MSEDLLIRLASEEDLVAINEIYNYYVTRSTCTYQETDEPIASRRDWLAKHGERHPATVATRNGRVVGWGSLSAFHTRSAYRFTVENSVYVDPAMHRQGIGKALLADLIQRARQIGYHAVIAIIDSRQPASVALHAKLGFQKVAHYKEIGFKFGQWQDVITMQLTLPVSEKDLTSVGGAI